jgi:SAM-dependent methyltransferase
MVSSDVWDEQTASSYAEDSADMFDPAVVGPTVDFLRDLCAGGSALEFAVGTGRVAIPLSRSGIRVCGIELSPAMVTQLRTGASEAEIPVVTGDMATTMVPGEFDLVYLVYNGLSNLRLQDEQVACFRNAAGHLRPGGHFVVELFVPPLRRLPPGQTAVPFAVEADHVGFDTIDPVSQACRSHHFTRLDNDTWRHDVGNFRYAWPSECDLMAQLAGLGLVARYADWDRSAFTAESTKHVSVWRRPV